LSPTFFNEGLPAKSARAPSSDGDVSGLEGGLVGIRLMVSMMES
jgi:hypothetical protein